MRNILIILSFFFLGVSQCTQPVIIDDSIAPIESNDTTVVIEGCGNQPVVGYTYCRVREGTSATSTYLTLIVPPISNCHHNECVYYKIFFPNGDPSIGGAIEKGKTFEKFSWSTLTKKDVFEKEDRGYWIVLLEVFFLDNDGVEHRSTAEGEIRLRVYRSEYLPLYNIPDDPNFNWEFLYNKFTIRMTTNLRSYVGGISQ